METQQEIKLPARRSYVTPILLIVIIILAALSAYLWQTKTKPTTQVSGTEQNQQVSTQESTNPLTGVTNPPKPSDSENASPKMLFSSGTSLQLWSKGQFTTLVDHLKDSEQIWDVRFSPDRTKIVYGHYNYDKDGSGTGIFGSGINTLGLITLGTNKASELGVPKETAKWHISWSPDNRYISYVVNDGQALEILNVESNKVVAKISGKNTSAAIWLKPDLLSFVQDNKIYIGGPTNPKAKVVAENVDNSLCVFEGPSITAQPNWSKDGRFVSYATRASHVIKDTKSGTITKIRANKTKDDYCGDSIDLAPIGWDKQNNFYFSTNNYTTVQKVSMPSGEQSEFKNPYAGSDARLTQISPDGNYMLYTSGSVDRSSWFTINEPGENGPIICHNELSIYKSNGPANSDPEATWSVKYPGVVAVANALPKGAAITLFDVKNCKYLETVTVLEGPNDDHHDSFVGIE